MSITPDMIEPVVGYRTWNAKIYRGQMLLQSLVWKELWLPNTPMRAECLNYARLNKTPCCGKYFVSKLPLGCTCGIYAHRNKQQLASAQLPDKEHYKNPLWRSAIVHGEVNLWGRVLQAKNGFRAQYAYPKRLFVHAYLPNQLERCEILADTLGKLYQVPTQLIIAFQKTV